MQGEDGNRIIPFPQKGEGDKGEGYPLLMNHPFTWQMQRTLEVRCIWTFYGLIVNRLPSLRPYTSGK